MSALSLPADPKAGPGVAATAMRADPAVIARRRARLRRRGLVQAMRIGIAVFALGSWQLLTSIRWPGVDTTEPTIVDPFFYGQPTGIASQILKWAQHGTAQGPLWEQVAVTMEETVLGFIIGVVLGVIFGILFGRNPFLADVFAPYIKAANSIPRVVLGSIFLLAFGLGLQSKVALAVVLVFFVVFFNAFQGVREVDRNLIANARILGAGGRRLTTEVIIPSALSWILASLHTSFGFALVGAVVGEYLGATQGVGLMIVTAQNTFNANGVYAAIVILATVALVAEALVTALENRLIRWRPNQVTEVTV